MLSNSSSLESAEHRHAPFQRSDGGLHSPSDDRFELLAAVCARSATRRLIAQSGTTVIDEGVHWLVTPCGERFFSIGVNANEGGYPQRFADGRIAYHWGIFYPDLEDWARTAPDNGYWPGALTLPVDGPSIPLILGLPITPDLELGRSARFHWFDPFDPATAEHMHAWARRMVAPYKGNPYRIGYFMDNEVGWWNGALFIYYLKQPATNHTKQRLSL